MDRLPALITLCLLLSFACEKQDASSTERPARSRFDSVAAKPVATDDVDAFCDVRFAAKDAPRLDPLPLAGDAPWPRAEGGWQWINVWATWCKPCIEEMPRIEIWAGELAREGVSVTMTYLGADADDDAVASFRARHPDLPDGPRLADPDALPGWLGSLGTNLGAALPVHIFIHPDGTVRCARAASVEDTDREALELLLRSDG